MDPLTGALILGGLNVGMGAMKAQQQAKQRQAEAQIRAAEIEASPWTGKAASTQVSTASPNVWAEMAGGAVNTLGQMAAIQNAGLFKTASNTPVEGGLDSNIVIGGQELSPASKQSAGYFSMKDGENNPFSRPMSSRNTWNLLASR